MTDAKWGMGIGGSIAGGLMIFSLVLLIKEVYEYCTYEPPPPRPQPPPPTHDPVPAPPIKIPNPVVEATCLLPRSEEYLRSLKLDLYFEQQSDCFCMKCRPDNSRRTNKRGGYPYTVPYGWVRFRIKTEKVYTQDKQIFQQWATSYYGTWEENLERILRNRVIPIPGDVLLDGTKFKDHSRDGQHCFTSPSINYTSNWQRSPKKAVTLSDGKAYDVQMILQCKQKPGTFIVQPGTPGLCNIISADVIEWKSNQRTTIIPNGLMIRIMKR